MTTTTKLETIEQPAAVQISARAVLVSLHISTWVARKYDRKVSHEVNEQHGAEKDAGRYNKHLLGGRKEAELHQAVLTAASQARVAHYANTLEWRDGQRLLPTANFEKHAQIMRETRAEFERKLEDFIAAYPEMRERAKILLNGLFNENDYPTSGRLRAKFAFDVEYTPLPARGDFRLDTLPLDRIAEMEAQVERSVRRATETAMRDAWNRLYELAGKFFERCGTDGSPKQPLVDDGRELVAVLGRLNVTDDPQLRDMLAQLDQALLKHDAVTLREHDDLKAATQKRAAEIMAKMQSVYGGLGGAL